MQITLPSTRTVKLISGENTLNRNKPRLHTEEAQIVKNLNSYKWMEKENKWSKNLRERLGWNRKASRKKQRKKHSNTEIMKTSYKSLEATRCHFRSLLWRARHTAMNHAETGRTCVMWNKNSVTYFNQKWSHTFDACHKKEEEWDASNLPISASVNDEP
jgi:hypothetical protein